MSRYQRRFDRTQADLARVLARAPLAVVVGEVPIHHRFVDHEVINRTPASYQARAVPFTDGACHCITWSGIKSGFQSNLYRCNPVRR